MAAGSGNGLAFCCGIAVDGLKHCWLPGWGDLSRERSLQKLTVVGDSLENYPGFASNKDVAFPFLRMRSSNCAKKPKKRMAQPIWLKLDEIARTVGRIYGDVGPDWTIAAFRLSEMGYELSSGQD
jgi:hypothetical protein